MYLGCTGVGYSRVGRGRVIPVHSPAARGGSICTAKRARKPCKGWSGGTYGAGRPSSPRTTLRARSVPCRPLPVLGLPSPSKAASGPIKARLGSILRKVSQNGQVSPESVEKAYHSPYFQNGLQNSPLEIPRFPFSVAFSGKELMVPF